MTLNELLRYDVVDSRGDVIGQIHDVSFARGDGDDYELTHIVFQPGGFGVRLGYSYPDMQGPWPLSTLMRAWSRRGSKIARWDQITEIRDGRVHLGVTVDELTSTMDFVGQRS